MTKGERRVGLKRPLQVKVGAVSVRQFHLPIYEFRHPSFHATRPWAVARYETADRGVYETPLGGIEEGRHIIRGRRCCFSDCAVSGRGAQNHHGRGWCRTEKQIASVES